MQNVIIIGAGGHGSELYSYIVDLAKEGKDVRLVGFVDEKKEAGKWRDTKIIGDLDALKDFLRAHFRTKFYYITAVGDNKVRQGLVARVERLGAKNIIPFTIRHPDCIVGQDITIGWGTCLAPGSIITTRATIGAHCILNVQTSVSHDCALGDFANLNPGAVVCGDVTIGEGCYIGAGATIIDKVSIGDWTVIGAGAVVTKDLPGYVTAVGVPARVIKKHKRGA